MRIALLLLISVLPLTSCISRDEGPRDAGTSRPPKPAEAPATVPLAPPPPVQIPPLPDSSWRQAYDFDGDGRNDEVIDDFTGGAHCCYRISVALSSTGKTAKLPFNIDGGYPMGLDLTQPDQFAIRSPEGALPELVMEIETYNGRPARLDPAWVRRYGIRTHRVAVCFAGGKVMVRDFVPDLPPCRTRSSR